MACGCEACRARHRFWIPPFVATLATRRRRRRAPPTGLVGAARDGRRLSPRRPRRRGRVARRARQERGRGAAAAPRCHPEGAARGRRRRPAPRRVDPERGCRGSRRRHDPLPARRRLSLRLAAHALALRDASEPQPRSSCSSRRGSTSRRARTRTAATWSTTTKRRTCCAPRRAPSRARSHSTTPACPLGRADPSGLPPTLLQVGTAELLLDECREWCARARAVGVALTVDEPADMPHAPPFFAAFSPRGAKALADVAAFVRHHLAAARTG